MAFLAVLLFLQAVSRNVALRSWREYNEIVACFIARSRHFSFWNVWCASTFG
jgi:hypothetical protein